VSKPPDKFDLMGREIASRLFDVFEWPTNEPLAKHRHAFAMDFQKRLTSGHCVLIRRTGDGGALVRNVPKKKGAL
jgi:hypothetical protein